MTSGTATDPHADRRAEAAAWRARLAFDEPGAEAGLAAWLAAHPDNPAAWTATEGGWALFEDASPDLAAVVHTTLARARAERGRRRLSYGGVAAAAVLAILAGAFVAWPRHQAFETAGERRQVTLADGSRLALDADTKVSARFTPWRRDLILERGQARFVVAHAADRPFAVTAGQHRVVATGTRFNIDLVRGTARVTLLEGSVRVEPLSPLEGPKPRAIARSIRLIPGQQLVAGPSPETPVRVAMVDPGKALAWEGGQLVFDEEPLSEVVARINRYSAVKVFASDPIIGAQRISGVFIAGDVDTFVDAVSNHLALRAVRTAPDRIELRPAAG